MASLLTQLTARLRRLAGAPLGLLLAACLLAGMLSAAQAQTARALTPYQLKGALLGRIIKFVEWPTNSYSTTNSPLVVAIVGRDPFGPDLEVIFSPLRVNDRRVIIQNVTDASDIPPCHVLFVAPSEEKRVREILAQVSGKPVLTASDVPQFTAHGGMLQFLVEDKKVQFDLDERAARAAGLSISAQLMKYSRGRGGKD